MLRLALFQTYEDIEAFLSGELIWWAITLPLECPGVRAKER
jgi:hypothetical protein